MIAILLAASAAAAWAIGMTVAKPGVRAMDLVSYTMLRWALVSILALAYVWGTGRWAVPSPSAVLLAMGAGVLDCTFGGFFYLKAMERTAAHRVIILSSSAPLWGVIGSVVFLEEPFLWTTLGAAALVVTGAVFLTERRQASGPRPWVGAVFALFTGLLWGFAETVPTKLALQQGMTAEMLLLVFAASGGAGMLLLAPLLRRRIPRRVTPRGYLLVALSAVAGAFLGWLLWLNALGLAPASVLSPIRGSTLLFALMYSVVFLRERPTRRVLIGVAFVAAGVFLVSWTY
ncbi:MAG TPA: DMT family transporter [Candidatus Acetothermia bacterium]|nr:DMT family transporter [Candidatus Acetothermia bacterium]